MSNFVNLSKLYFQDKSNRSRERVRILRRQIIIAIQDKRIYKCNIKKYQDFLSQSLT